MNGLHEGTQVADLPVTARVLDDHGERVRVGRLLGRTGDDVDFDRRSARANDVERLREHVVRDEQPPRPALADAQGERHRLGRRRALVQHRCVRDRHAGQVANHRLEIDQRLEPALRDLRLVGRVRRVPRRVLEHVAQDHPRRDRAVVALADERRERAVFRGDRAQSRQRRGFVHRVGQRERRLRADRRRDQRIDQRGARSEPEHVQHLRLVFGRAADVAGDEGVVRLEIGERLAHVRSSGIRIHQGSAAK